MTSVVLPTFRRSAFRRPPRSLQAPWGPGMPGTHYVLRGDEYDLRVQDASPAITGRASLKRARRQRGGIYPGARANNPSAIQITQMERALRARHPTNPPRPPTHPPSRGGFYPGARANNPPPSRIAQMQRAIRARHPTNPQRRQRAASRALANSRSERLARGANRALWSVRRHPHHPDRQTGCRRCPGRGRRRNTHRPARNRAGLGG